MIFADLRNKFIENHAINGSGPGVAIRQQPFCIFLCRAQRSLSGAWRISFGRRRPTNRTNIGGQVGCLCVLGIQVLLKVYRDASVNAHAPCAQWFEDFFVWSVPLRNSENRAEKCEDREVRKPKVCVISVAAFFLRNLSQSWRDSDCVVISDRDLGRISTR